MATPTTCFHIHGVTSRGADFINPRVAHRDFDELLKVFATMLQSSTRPRALYIAETKIRSRELVRYVAAYNPEGIE